MRSEKPWKIGPFKFYDTGKVGLCWAIIIPIAVISFKFAKDSVVEHRKVQMKERREIRSKLLKEREQLSKIKSITDSD